jgi:hypothetical protein
MGELTLAFLIFAAVVIVTAVLFGGWVIIGIAKTLGAILGIGPRPSAKQAKFRSAAPVAQVVQCRIVGCGHLNPANARFCRHCGHAFPQFQKLSA